MTFRLPMSHQLGTGIGLNMARTRMALIISVVLYAMDSLNLKVTQTHATQETNIVIVITAVQEWMVKTMRLIDADVLIEFVEGRYTVTWNHDYDGGIKDACIDILNFIDIAPTIDAVPRWIPCEERLPEPTQEVLVTGINGCVYTSRIVHGEFEYGGNVIAWMPLPLPYKGERRDDD